MVLYGVALIGMGSFYTWPNEEAIYLTGDAKYSGIFNAAQAMLETQDGRYFTNLLHGLNPLAWGWFEGYKLIPAFGFLLFVLCSMFLMRSFLHITAKAAFAYAALFTTIHFALSPTLVNELFNLIGSYVYLYGLCLWMLWVGALARFIYAKSNIGRYGYFLVCAFALIGSTGCNEQMLVLNGMSLLFALALFVIYSKQQLPDFIPLLLIGVISSLFFISCPGLRVRAITFEHQHNYNHLGNIISLSTQHYWFNLKMLLTQSAFLFPALCVFVFAGNARPLLNFQHKGVGKIFWISCLFWGLTTYLITFAFYLPMGNDISFPERIYVPVCTLLQILFCAALIYVQPKQAVYRNVLRYIALVWCGVALLSGNNNYTTMWREYRSGEYDALNNIMTQRLQRLRLAAESTAGWKQACFNLYEEKENMIYYPVEFKPNRQNESCNVALEKYFKLNEAGYCTDTITRYKRLLEITHED